MTFSLSGGSLSRGSLSRGSLSRRRFAGAGAAALGAAGLGAAVFGGRTARAATHALDLGVDVPSDHPIGVHLLAAAKAIATATQGEVRISVFTNNALGNDTHMLAQLRSGALPMMAIGDNILAELVPSAAISNIGFAFKDAGTAFAAMDGAVGDIVRQDIRKAGLYPMARIWDLGFREITASTRPIAGPEDMRGFKIRVPPSPISLSLFRGLGASPLTLNVAELYTALQTRLADGQETPLDTIEVNRYYEVQKYGSMTNHMWTGYWVLAGAAAWSALPARLRAAVEGAFNDEAPAERRASEALNASLVPKLRSQGLIINTPDPAPFRAALAKSGFYGHWQAQFGSGLWSALEKYSGPIA